jgi:hypothetical protein
MSGLLDECLEAPITTGKEGKEPRSHCLCGGVSIVRAEEEFCNIGGFPRLPPGQ